MSFKTSSVCVGCKERSACWGPLLPNRWITKIDEMVIVDHWVCVFY